MYKMITESKSIRLRLVEKEDAAFIVNLRIDSRYNKFLSFVDNDVEKQIQWIEHYKNDEKLGNQFYFIIERLDNGRPCGTVRIYDINRDEKSFVWGSWILNDNATEYAFIESSILIYKIAFQYLACKIALIDVIKKNKRVWKYHKLWGAEQIGEDEVNYYYSLTKEVVLEKMKYFESQIR